MSKEQAELSDAIYCMAMRLTDKGEKPETVDAITRNACAIGGIDYPPQQKETT